MTSARVPSWWLVVGAETSNQLEDLFGEVMAELPMSHRELADRLEVNPDPSTVTRWASGETTPAPETMLDAVEKVRAYLEPRLQRARVAEEALRHLVGAEDAYEEDDQEAMRNEASALREILDDWEG